MGNDIKSPQHMSVHPMYVSYTSIPTGSASSTQINSKKDSNQFGVVLTSINNSNTNSLSSTYIKNHCNMPSSLNNIAKHHQTQSPTHYQLIEHRQLSSSSNLSQYNSRNNLISKSASTQQIIKRNPSFTNSGSNRSDIRYTEIISTTDEILARDDKDVDTFSNRSYFMPSSTASTAAASPITSNKLMATNLQQQQLISRNFGIQNPLNHLIQHNVSGDNEGIKVNTKHMGDVEMNGQQSPLSTRSYSPTATRYDHSNPNKHNMSNQVSSLSKSGYTNSNHHHHHHSISSPPEKLGYQCNTRSPNLNHMPRRRPLPPIPQEEIFSSNSGSNNNNNNKASSTVTNMVNAATAPNCCDQIRDKPSPMRYNLKQFIPEYNCPNPIPAIPPHMLQHPMYRVRSQDRISNRMKRQSGAGHLAGAYQHENQRPRSFCNNMINYQDYKDLH
jgi:hypothetical protein